MTRDDPVLGLRAVDERRNIVLDRPETIPLLRRALRPRGVPDVNFVPLVFRDEALGLLVLYHRTPYDWTPDELELCTTFANQMAIAVANARLFNSVREGAARLRAIQELSSRLNRIQEIEGIGEAIVGRGGQADRPRHDPRLPRGPRHADLRAHRVPGRVHGHRDAVLRPPAGADRRGPHRAGSRSTTRRSGWATRPRTRAGARSGGSRGAESMLLVPMSYEARVLGVIVLSKAGYDQYTEDDQRTLEIFAGYAAQALVNAEAFGQVRRQQQELRHRLESQRRLLEVNERLLSTLDPGGVLEMIADSLKTVVAYDSLTIYRVDRDAWVRARSSPATGSRT